MTTTPAQVDGVKEACRLLAQQPGIKAAMVDDWGRFGNFTVFVTPQTPNRHTTRRLRSQVKLALTNAGCSAHVRKVFAPDPVRRRDADGRLKVVGYARAAWTVDIDYQTYDPNSNTFA